MFSVSDMNKLVAAINALMNPQVIWGESDGVDIADANTTIRLSRATATTSPGSGGASVTMYHLKSVQDDYVTCKTWDGASEGSTDVYLAKEWEIRTSLASESVLGTTHNYTYGAGPDSNNLIRTDDDGTNSQDEIITPPWSVDEVVFAVSGPTDVLHSSTPVDLLLIGRSAQWAKVSPISVTPLTPATSAATTNGYTSGLIVVDGSYIYVSTALNTWKRVAISSW